MKAATVVLAALMFAGSFLAGHLWAQRGTQPTVLSGDSVGVEVVTPLPDRDGRVGVRYMVKLQDGAQTVRRAVGGVC
jgi:hypothetical protein